MEDKLTSCGRCNKPKGTKQEGECKCGRPTTFKEEYVEEVYEYIKECVEKSKKIETFELPTREGFAVQLGTSREVVWGWAKEHDEFSNALRFLDSNQCKELVNGGLTSKLNSTIAKLILSSNHGMRERTDVTSDDKPIPILGNVQNNDSHKEDSGTDQKNPSSSGGDSSEQDDLDSLIPDQ